MIDPGQRGFDGPMLVHICGYRGSYVPRTTVTAKPVAPPRKIGRPTIAEALARQRMVIESLLVVEANVPGRR